MQSKLVLKKHSVHGQRTRFHAIAQRRGRVSLCSSTSLSGVMPVCAYVAGPGLGCRTLMSSCHMGNEARQLWWWCATALAPFPPGPTALTSAIGHAPEHARLPQEDRGEQSSGLRPMHLGACRGTKAEVLRQQVLCVGCARRPTQAKLPRSPK